MQRLGGAVGEQGRAGGERCLQHIADQNASCQRDLRLDRFHGATFAQRAGPLGVVVGDVAHQLRDPKGHGGVGFQVVQHVWAVINESIDQFVAGLPLAEFFNVAPRGVAVIAKSLALHHAVIGDPQYAAGDDTVSAGGAVFFHNQYAFAGLGRHQRGQQTGARADNNYIVLVVPVLVGRNLAGRQRRSTAGSSEAAEQAAFQQTASFQFFAIHIVGAP